MAEIFFPTARALIGYIGHMTSNNELFPAKIYEPATLQNL